MAKPPAFQFYAKDWRSSPTVRRMTLEQRGIYIDLLALAWDSEEPGVISLSIPAICRELRIWSATLRRLFADYPTTFREVNGKLVSQKLVNQFAKYNEISIKRSEAAKSRHANASHLHQSASASASASAITSKTKEIKSSRLDDLKISFLAKCKDPRGEIAAVVEIICERAAKSGTVIKTEAYIARAVETFNFEAGQDREELQQFMRGSVN